MTADSANIPCRSCGCGNSSRARRSWKLLYPDGDWLAAFGVANLAIYEDSLSEQPPDLV